MNGILCRTCEMTPLVFKFVILIAPLKLKNNIRVLIFSYTGYKKNQNTQLFFFPDSNQYNIFEASLVLSTQCLIITVVFHYSFFYFAKRILFRICIVYDIVKGNIQFPELDSHFQALVSSLITSSIRQRQVYLFSKAAFSKCSWKLLNAS